MKKTIVVFANSFKHHEHCVAGKEISSKKWIRPVSSAAGGALSEAQVLCKNPYGEFPVKVLQKVELELDAHVPLINQPENYLVSQSTWIQCFKLNASNITPYLDYPDILWDNNSSSYHGTNDRVAFHRINNREVVINQSLYLINPDDLRYYITTDQQNHKRIRAAFKLSGISYDLAVTDTNIWKWLEREAVGHEEKVDSGKVLCISLGETFNDGYCYKLVASSIPLE
jgi:hypothetical protein